MKRPPELKGWNDESRCIRCGTPVPSRKDFCSKDCEDAFLGGE